MNRTMFSHTFCVGWACMLAAPVCALHNTPNQAVALQTPNATEEVKDFILFDDRPNQSVALQTPNATEEVKDFILFDDQPIPNPFKNILLVIHCRLPMFLLRQDPGLCAKREPLYQGYKNYFGNILWMTRDNCPHSFLEPHNCIVKLTKEEMDTRDGIFYLHFDALIRPSTLAPTFDKTSMAFFGREDACRLTYRGTLTNCTWDPWDRWAKPYLRAISKLKLKRVVTGTDAEQIADPRFAWIGMDDVFYIPSQAFKLYADITKVFGEGEGVHHEVAGPSIRRILSRMINVEDKSLGCTGDCCHALGAEVALRPDFRCGHAFRLQEQPTRDAFKSVLALRRDRQLEGRGGAYGSIEVQASILEQATA